jgi:protein-S-isoprenylcysteine O-methyltransferase Ste14
MALSFGWALSWRSAPALLLAVAQALLLRSKATLEEERLRARFPQYDAYARRVPRFLPRLGRDTN